MKIIIYINSINASGGIERVIANLLQEWCKCYEIILLTKDDGRAFYKMPESISYESIRVDCSLDMNSRLKRVIRTGNGILLSVNKLRKKLNSLEYDYIYTTNPVNALEIYLAVGGSKLIASEHGSFYGYNKIYQSIKKFLYPRVYAISVPNKMDNELYRNWGANSYYIPHIVTFNVETRNELNTKIALNVGRLTSDKRHDLLIEMWAKIPEKKGWNLYIVGEGEEEKRLKDLVIERQQQDSVFILPVTNTIEEYYRKASLFVFSSRFEGFGMVLLEAMSFGIPCISFDCPSGPRDIIEDGVNGYLINEGDTEAFIQCVKQYINETQEEREKTGVAAYNTAKEWNNEAIIQKWNQIIK